MVTTSHTEIPVPCGKCPPCLKRRANGWAFRLKKHDMNAISAHFVTLTFNTDHVPITPGAGYMTLDKVVLQKFFKRLRKRYPKDHPKISYYAVGEYGGIKYRPHYHIILFNADRDNIEAAWQAIPPGSTSKIPTPIGSIDCGSVTSASIGYTLKYMCKPRRIPRHRNDDRLPEFSLMSKGLGATYLTPEMLEWHKADLEHRFICAIEDGKVISMPRYYKNKIYTEDERNQIAAAIARENLERMSAEVEKGIQEFGESEYIRILAEQKTLSYRKMYKNAEQGRHLD